MGRKKHLEYIKEFKKRLSEDIPISKIVLFGSRVGGKPGRWSDFDLIIVSPQFKNESILTRGAKMYDYWDLDYPVDFLCYTPKEFNRLKKQISIVREALKTGIIIK